METTEKRTWTREELRTSCRRFDSRLKDAILRGKVTYGWPGASPRDFEVFRSSFGPTIWVEGGRVLASYGQKRPTYDLGEFVG